MFLQELRKIWRKERILLMIIVILIITLTFLLPQIRFVTHTGEDAFAVGVGIVRDWISQYGEQITKEEYEKIQHTYLETLSAAQRVISAEPYFAQDHVYTYEDYLAYSQNAINGTDGYSYDHLRKMRDLLSANTKYSAIYYQEYENLMKSYAKSISGKTSHIEEKLSGRAKVSALSSLAQLKQTKGQGSPLPYEFAIAANKYFIYLAILCVILTMFISAPVMVVCGINPFCRFAALAH